MTITGATAACLVSSGVTRHGGAVTRAFATRQQPGHPAGPVTTECTTSPSPCGLGAAAAVQPRQPLGPSTGFKGKRDLAAVAAPGPSMHRQRHRSSSAIPTNQLVALADQ